MEKEIYLRYMMMFPNSARNTYKYEWENKETYSIHLWQKDGRELVFSFKSPEDWCIETYEHYKVRVS